ncbi:hypothetical protein [Thermococcus sp.]|uniref:hypothetical protein n=1 Tax=Thermococcus sp. TaxID=35749 RepID=UPI00261A170F|nr:hypothetical protein [Thermococcus sp.]
MRKGKRPFERPLLLLGEAISQPDTFNRQFFEWNGLLRFSRKKRKLSSPSV